VRSHINPTSSGALFGLQWIESAAALDCTTTVYSQQTEYVPFALGCANGSSAATGTFASTSSTYRPVSTTSPHFCRLAT
jgi:hypothetical protein